MVCCAANANSNYIYNLYVYYGITIQILEVGKTSCVVANFEHKVVSKLTQGIENKEPFIVIDNFFTSV